MYQYDVDAKPEQIEAIEWAVPRTGYLLALPISFGKTMCALTIIKRWRAIYGPWKVLLVSTKSICHHTWEEELESWDHLIGTMTYANAAGRNLAAAQQGADITGVNFESLEWYLDLVDEGRVSLPEVLVIDESSKMKAYNAHRVCRLTGLRYVGRSQGRKVVESMGGYVDRFKRRILLSATPNPESYADLFAQEACIDTRRRFGPNITSFRNEFCQRDRSGFGYEVVKAMEPVIEERMKHIMYMPKYDDYLGLPDPLHVRQVVPWTDEEREQYDELEDSLALVLESGKEDCPLDEVEVEAPNAGVLLSKLRQLCSGFIYDHKRTAHRTNTVVAKCDALAEIRERSGDTPLLVFTQFKAEAAHIAERFGDAHIGLPDSLSGWSTNSIPMLVLHPRSAGHGLNLQHGSHICVYYSLPYSYEEWAQSWGRLQRRGQTHQVSCIRLERPNSVEQDVWRTVQGKKAKLSAFFKHMRARREAA